jgi:hypothetical protein
MKRALTVLAALGLLVSLAAPALAAGKDLPETGRVLISIGGDVDLPAGEQADAVIVVNGDAHIFGTANGVVVIDGTATLTSATVESVFVVNGTAELQAGTTVLHDVLELDGTISRADGVSIGGSIRGVESDLASIGLFIGAAAVILWIGFGAATLTAGLLLAGLAARQVRAAGSLISHEPGKTAIAGLLALIVPPILAVLAMVTLVGIPLGVSLLVFVWPTVAFIGYLVAAIWLGEWVLRRGNPQAQPAARPYGAAVVGLLIAFVLGFVPLVTFVISFFGLGAVVLAAWRTLRGHGTAQPIMQTQLAPAAG